MNWSPAFSKRCTHLLCPSKQGPKYDRAQEWKILIVDLEWLKDIAISGRIPSVPPTSFADITNGKCHATSQTPRAYGLHSLHRSTMSISDPLDLIT